MKDPTRPALAHDCSVNVFTLLCLTNERLMCSSTLGYWLALVQLRVETCI